MRKIVFFVALFSVNFIYSQELFEPTLNFDKPTKLTIYEYPHEVEQKRLLEHKYEISFTISEMEDKYVVNFKVLNIGHKAKGKSERKTSYEEMIIEICKDNSFVFYLNPNLGLLSYEKDTNSKTIRKVKEKEKGDYFYVDSFIKSYIEMFFPVLFIPYTYCYGQTVGESNTTKNGNIEIFQSVDKGKNQYIAKIKIDATNKSTKMTFIDGTYYFNTSDCYPQKSTTRKQDNITMVYDYECLVE